MKKNCLLIGLLSILSTFVSAQIPTGDVEQINMSHVLVYYFPFYIITFTVLSFFIYWLLKPSDKLRNGIYALAIVGIIGGFLLNQQLPQWEHSEEEEAKNIVQTSKEFKQNMESISGFWVIALPNISIVLLTAGINFFIKKK